MPSEADQLSVRLLTLQRQRDEVLAEEAHVQAELVRLLRTEAERTSAELKQTEQQLATAKEELEMLAPVEEAFRRLRGEIDGGDEERPSTSSERLLEAAITFGRARPAELLSVTGNLPAVRLAHALMANISERLANQRITESVRGEVVALLEQQQPSEAWPARREAAAASSSSAAAAYLESRGSTTDEPSAIESPSPDVVGALLEHLGGWYGACVLECVSRAWRLAVLGWRRYEQSVHLQTRGDGVFLRTGSSAITAVARCCPRLTELQLMGRRDATLHNARDVNDESCRLLAHGCQRLQRLVLRDCAAISSDGLAVLAGLEELEYLDLAGCEGVLRASAAAEEGTDETTAAQPRWVECVRAVPTLKRLVLYSCSDLTEADEATLTKDGRVSLERISCGCEPCVGFASASLRLRLALLAANAEMAVAGNEGGGDNARLD